MPKKQCSKCQKDFGCGAGSGSGRCWCMSFPPIMPLESDLDCFCPSCLGMAVEEKIISLISEKGLGYVQSLAEPYREQSELLEHVDYKLKDSQQIYSTWYLVKQGQCCDDSCQNCPY